MAPSDRNDPGDGSIGDDGDDSSGVRAAVLVALLDDHERGQLRDLEHYRRRFPGFDALIEEEFRAFVGAADAPRDDGMPGAYRRQGELGRGGMGVVHRVLDPGLQRQLALKQARPGATDAEHARFLEEARITAQLDHPGVVPVHELGLDDGGAPYFTMQMVRGRTFAQLIDELHEAAAEDRWRRSVQVLVRVCEAIAFAHSRGVVHRDLKPQNIMVGRFGEVFVMDWGLARAVGRPLTAAAPPATDGHDEVPARDGGDTPEWTLAGDVLGTPSYMAPEQLTGSADVHGSCDIYALGAILYHALVGRAPFDDGDGAGRPILERVAAGPPTPVATLAPQAPAELVAICERAMARPVDERYGDVEALRDDLQRFDAGRVVRAYEQGTWAELRKWVQRNRGITVAAAAAVLALAVGFVVSLVQRERADDEALRANLSFRDSVDAVQRMLTRVGSETLDNVPQTAPIRRDLLRDASEFFDRFLSQRPDDRWLKQQAASAHFRVGQLQIELGDHDDGFASIRRSLSLADGILARDPRDREVALQVAQAHFQLGSAMTTLGAYAEAEAELQEALDVAGRLVDERRDRRPLAMVGTIRDALALLAYRTRRLDDTVRHATASAELRSELVERFGDDNLGALGTPHGLLAGVHMQRRELPQARDQLLLAADARRRYQRRNPDDDDARAKLAETLTNLAAIEHAMRADRDAAESIAEAVALRAANAEREPRIPRRHRGLAATLAQQAKFQRDNGDPETAAITLGHALASIERALALAPDSRASSNTLHGIQMELYHVAATTRNREALAEHAAAMVGNEAAERPARLDAIRQLCSWVRFCRGLVDDPEATELAERHAQTALDLLQALADDDGLRAADLTADYLDPIRERPEFEALLR